MFAVAVGSTPKAPRGAPVGGQGKPLEASARLLRGAELRRSSGAQPPVSKRHKQRQIRLGELGPAAGASIAEQCLDFSDGEFQVLPNP